ncbi:GNAT family N-acetyltransferase [Romboutsia sp.]|uniref:GNAT family N-acetyltransferase n=1 Tax=Romboutsia sp. TaxID=1965302 RepID=UPI003F3A8911
MKTILMSYYDIDDFLKRSIINLQNKEWNNCYWGDTPFIKNCVCCFEGDKLVSYLSIVKKSIIYKKEEYVVAGLSEVITDIDYRCKGIGANTIKVAFDYIKKDNCDFSTFTCSKGLSNFYTKAGWKTADNLSIIGGTFSKPMNSNEMNLQTMIALFSDKAKTHSKDFENGELFLDIGEGKIW